MEKDFRLFVKNLPINYTEAQVNDLFTNQQVTVKKVDLKEKKDLDNKLHKFAFVNVTTSDKQLYNCFGALKGERIDGFEISVEVAKESFLDRLKREREENQSKKVSVDLTPKPEYVKPIVTEGFNNAPKAKHKKFFDDDFTPDINIKDKKSKKRKIESEELPVQEHSEQNDEQIVEKSETSFESVSSTKSESSKAGAPKKKFKFKSYDDYEEEESNVKKCDDAKTKNVEIKKNKNLNNSQKITQKPEISESERKRQLSLKQKKSAFRAQGQLIRNALRSVDNNTSNNKIIFDDEIEMENGENERPKIKKVVNEKKALFNSDDEDEAEEKVEWNEEELEAKSQVNQKLMKLQAKIGYDERFVLDERFIEGEKEEENKEDGKQAENKEDISDEKQWQLKILKDVLGDSAKTPKPDTKDTAKKQNKMIRYDPTASNHEEFEINVEKPKKEKRAKKKVEQIERVQEPVPDVSKETFFNVENLTIGNGSGGFSLLQTSNDDSKVNGASYENENNSGFRFNFNADATDEPEIGKSKNKVSMFDSRNAFKCNSDDEDDNRKMTENGFTSNSTEFGFSVQEDNTVFFVNNDARFKEAVEFFKTPAVIDVEDFQNKRRGLREIVRSKIRNNIKKKIPWNKKNIRKVQRRN